MQIGFVGLGTMGGASGADSLEALVGQLEAP